MSGNQSNNGRRVTTQTYQHEIARGRVPGASIFGAYGVLTVAGAIENNIIWPNGAFTFPDQAGEDISFVSTDAQDSLGGTGINLIGVHYLDVNLEPQITFISLNGLTPVVGQLTGVRFIQDMFIMNAGASLSAEGTITAYRATDSTTIFSIIGIGKEKDESSLRMVPKGKVAFLQGAAGSAISGTAAARVSISIVATEFGNYQLLDPFILIPFSSIGMQDGGLTILFPNPIPFQEGTVIGMRTSSDKGATISGDWFGWIEDA